VQLPPATLDAIRERYGAPGLAAVLGTLHRPLMRRDPGATDRAARTLPHRNARNVGGMFVDLVREALRGELLIDRAEENARVQDAAAAARAAQFDFLDDATLAELVLRTQRHDPDRADTYRTELARRRGLPERARLTAADPDDVFEDGADDGEGIPWTDLFVGIDDDDVPF
jgi:hypothetical protein